MRDWPYYTAPTAKYHGYEKELAAQLRREIDETPMTAAQREKALKEMTSKVRERLRELNKPHQDEQSRLDAEFWRDAREELGYGKLVAEAGLGVIEGEAYERGHSSGYSEIYNCLLSLIDFVGRLAPHIKKGAER